MRNGIFAVGIFRAVHAPAGKQAGQLRDGNAIELLVEDVVHPLLQIGDLIFKPHPQPLGNFPQKYAGFAGSVYKDVIFDTKPVARKAYKNSENRRKQGVSCGFRCTCRYSICAIMPRPKRG